MRSYFTLLIFIFFAGCWSPNTYEDCILENMKGVGSNVGAVEIRRACMKKFPKQTNDKNLKKG